MNAVTPIPSASAIILRRDSFEVLMLRRHENSSFVPNAWVFPGGAVDASDGPLGGPDELSTLRSAAVRETLEETGLALDADALVLTSRWITPEGLPKRFDTWFFLALAPEPALVTPQEDEVTDALWIAPAEALRRHKSKEMQMVFPTVRNLEAIASFRSASELIEARRGIPVEPIQPVLVDGKPVLR